MSQPLQLPIQPSSPSVQSHIQALDHLIAQLEALPSRTRWPAFIPLNSKASFVGQVVHTNDLKVNLGDGWWVEMTAGEAVEFLRRKKISVLEQYAGLSPSELVTGAEIGDNQPPSTYAPSLPVAPIQLNALFMKQPAEPETQAATQSGSAHATDHAVNNQLRSQSPEEPEASPPQPAERSQLVESKGGRQQDTASPAKAATLEEVLNRFVLNEQANAKGSGILRDQGVDENGLPIHEIRETASGDIIGEIPEPTQPVQPSDNVEIEAEDEGEKEDFWSEAAKAKRAALFRRVFNEDTDTDTDTDDSEVGDMEAANELRSGKLKPLSSPPPTFSPSPTSLSRAQSPSPPPITPNHPARRPSASLPPPSRSILKPPPTRKKSVSFDDSVPMPPDSPDTGGPSRMGFPLPGIDVSGGSEVGVGEFGVRPVPVIPPPVPGMKRSPVSPTGSASGNAERGFGGFARGFLNAPSKISGTDPSVATSAGSTVGPSLEKKISSAAESSTASKKRPSLFAQRMAQQTVKEVAPPGSASTRIDASESIGTADSSAPRLPKLAESASTPNVKPAVVERPPAVAVPPMPQSSISSGPSQPKPPQTSANTTTSEPNAAMQFNLLDDDEEEEGDLELEIDDDEEDEYNLDDALLAREVALEYHKRQAYSSPYLTRDPDDPAYDDPVSAGDSTSFNASLLSPAERDQLSQGGVVLAIPSIDESTGKPRIVNPTPDDHRRYIRVGKLENGNLVLAPGQEGWSDDDDDGDPQGEGERATGREVGEFEEERRKRKESRQKAKRVLLGLEQEEAKQTPPAASVKAVRPNVETRDDMPPTIEDVSAERVITDGNTRPDKEESTSVESAEIRQGKKVSRFKAARLGS